MTEDEVEEVVIRVLRNASPQLVSEFHRRSDLDSKAESLHHSIGPRRNQAAPGDVTQSILQGVNFSGSRSSNVASILQQITQSLTKMGATDATVA